MKVEAGQAERLVEELWRWPPRVVEPSRVTKMSSSMHSVEEGCPRGLASSNEWLEPEWWAGEGKMERKVRWASG